MTAIEILRLYGSYWINWTPERDDHMIRESSRNYSSIPYRIFDQLIPAKYYILLGADWLQPALEKRLMGL